MSKFLILVDYKEKYLTSIENLHVYTSMNVQKICWSLTQYGHSVEVKKYSELDFTQHYKDYFILYQTAEDLGVFYKDYIEDIVYYLEMQGAILLPNYKYLLAHHNKNFMELLRYSFKNECLKTIVSRLYGTGEDALKETEKFPVVVKSAEGRGSKNVFLARNKEDLKKIINKISGVFLVNDLYSLKEFVIYVVLKKLINRVRTKYRRYTFYRKKFIVQNYIDGLQGDYKVLYFGGKYYALYRKNRDNDFRASGSGRLFPADEALIPDLLDFSRCVIDEIDFPIVALDVGYDGVNFHLFEFQFIHIGPYALQASHYWHEFVSGEWVKFDGCSNLEEEFCRSINEFIKRKDVIYA